MYVEGDLVIIPIQDALLPDVLQMYIDRLKQQARLRRGSEEISRSISEAELTLAHVIASQVETGSYIGISGFNT